MEAKSESLQDTHLISNWNLLREVVSSFFSDDKTEIKQTFTELQMIKHILSVRNRFKS